MDYEKAYKDALNRAKHALDCHNQGMVSTDVSLITSMFPELRESEDEQIRKALIEMVHDTPNSECEQNYNVRKEDCLTWLEKQGEQKLFDYEHADIQQKDFAPKVEWKPSDAQMDSITCAVRKMKESACYDSELVSLLNDLRKLWTQR